MVLLPEIKEKAQQLLDEAKTHSEHHLGWMKRRDFYELLGKSLETMSGKCRAWLVFLTAQRVLALFEQEFSYSDVPRRTLDYTEKFLLGELSLEKLYEWASDASIVVGTHWGTAYGPKRRELPTQTVLSGLAAAHVVTEITRGDPFRAIHLYSYKGPDGKDLTGDQWSDEKLGKSLAGDTASSASMAEAYDPNTQKADPVKLLKFWEWWLTDAIDEAWEKANGSPIKFM